MLNTNLTLLFKDLMSKSKFRKFCVKIKNSLDLLENLYTSQFEVAEDECYWSQFQPKFAFSINRF